MSLVMGSKKGFGTCWTAREEPLIHINNENMVWPETETKLIKYAGIIGLHFITGLRFSSHCQLKGKGRSRGRSKGGQKRRRKGKREVAEGMKKQWWRRMRMRKRK